MNFLINTLKLAASFGMAMFIWLPVYGYFFHKHNILITSLEHFIAVLAMTFVIRSYLEISDR